jgi:agmatine deiminase
MIITFLSDKMLERFPNFVSAMITISRKENAFVRILEGTQDIWIRDYMPILLPSGKMLQFKYQPSYLKNGYEHLITSTRLIENQLGFPLKKVNLTMDGGNYVRLGDKVMVCDRIFSENPLLAKKELITTLKYQLEASEVVVLPTHPFDPVGHADGIVAATDRELVLIDQIPVDACAIEKQFHLQLREVLSENSIKYLECFTDQPVDGYKNEWDSRGSYLNFSLVGNTLLLPVFQNTNTQRLLNAFIPLFPKRRIWMINCEDLAQEGGALHCVTWTA